MISESVSATSTRERKTDLDTNTLLRLIIIHFCVCYLFMSGTKSVGGNCYSHSTSPCLQNGGMLHLCSEDARSLPAPAQIQLAGSLWGGTAAGGSWDNPSGFCFFPKTVPATVKMQSKYLDYPKVHVVTRSQWDTDSKGIRRIPKPSLMKLQISVSAINRLPILAETY